MDTTGTTDIDDISRFPIFDSEVRRCGSYELEGCSLVYGEHSLPLFVRHLWIGSVSFMSIGIYTSSSKAIAGKHRPCVSPHPK